MHIRGIPKHLIIFSVITFILILLSGISQAATYYVSNSGSASWTNCTNISTPCSVQTAFSNAVAGDIVYFRGGTYNVPPFYNPYHGKYTPTNSGTSDNPITFAAFPGEIPLFNGVASSPDGSTQVIFGTYGVSYITFDGFSLQVDNGIKMAVIHIGSDTPTLRSVGITVKNCIINGGSTPIAAQDNRETIRIDYGDDILIQNCKLYNARSIDGYKGINAIKAYSANRVTVERNEIYNTEAGIYLKSDTDSWTIRNNWIHDNAANGIYITPYVTATIHNATNHKIYNNVIVNSGRAAIHVFSEAGANANNLEIYNNTFYSLSTSSTLSITESNNLKIYNNVIQGSPDNQMTFGISNYYINESDYNNFGSYAFTVIAHVYSGTPGTTTYDSLTVWQASCETTTGTTGCMGGTGHPDLHSIRTDPLFQNTSGTLTQLKDFKLASNSPCKGTGKGGVDMGADIFTVGIGVPSPPLNLRLQ